MSEGRAGHLDRRMTEGQHISQDHDVRFCGRGNGTVAVALGVNEIDAGAFNVGPMNDGPYNAAIREAPRQRG